MQENDPNYSQEIKKHLTTIVKFRFSSILWSKNIRTICFGISDSEYNKYIYYFWF
jgi:hypothetical protein